MPTLENTNNHIHSSSTIDLTLVTSSTTINPPPISMNKTKTFLLVDDVPTNRKFLRKLLEQRGHACEEAENGLIALNMVRDAINTETSVLYDAVFMDYVMPTMNGPDATLAIRELGYIGPIIGVTGNSHDDDQAYFMNAGLSDIIIKPLRMNKLAEIQALNVLRL